MRRGGSGIGDTGMEIDALASAEGDIGIVERHDGLSLGREQTAKLCGSCREAGASYLTVSHGQAQRLLYI